MPIINPEDYQALASNFVKGAPGQGAVGMGNFNPVRSARTGQQSAFQQLALARMRQKEAQRQMALDQESEMYEAQKKAQEPGLFDYLGIPLGIGNIVKGVKQKDDAGALMKKYGLE